MSKRMSQPATPAATMVTILPHHLEAGPCCPVPSHPFGDFKDKPAQGSATDADPDQLTGLLSVVCGSDMLMPAPFDQFIMRAHIAILSCLA
jgi:hypothetical protein